MRYRVLALVVLLALAGCNSIAGGQTEGSTTVSDAHIEMHDGGLVLAFSYSVTAPSAVLLEGPSGQVLRRGTLEPNSMKSGFYLSHSRGGSYTIIIKQGGSTQTTLTTTFAGSALTVENARGLWSKNTLRGVSVTVSNAGDMPARVSEIAVELRGAQISRSQNQWVPAGESRTLEIETGNQSGTVVESPGKVTASVAVDGSQQRIVGQFSRTFEPASLAVTNVTQSWFGKELSELGVTITNRGDLPGEGELVVETGAESVLTASTGPIPPGESRTIGFGDGGTVYTAESAGRISFSADIAATPDTSPTTFTHSIPGAELSLRNVDTEWANGELLTVSGVVENDATVTTSLDVAVLVNGETVYTDGSFIGGNETLSLSISGENGSLYVAENGTNTVELRVTPEYGNTVSERSQTTVTTTASVTAFGLPAKPDLDS